MESNIKLNKENDVLPNHKIISKKKKHLICI